MEEYIKQDNIGSKKHPFKLTFSPSLKYQLKKYCNYKAFSFLFKTEKEREASISAIQKELIRKKP